MPVGCVDGEKTAAKKPTLEMQNGLPKDSPFFMCGRSTRIRTLDPLVPNQVRYRAALHSEKRDNRGYLHFGQLFYAIFFKLSL